CLLRDTRPHAYWSSALYALPSFTNVVFTVYTPGIASLVEDRVMLNFPSTICSICGCVEIGFPSGPMTEIVTVSLFPFHVPFCTVEVSRPICVVACFISSTVLLRFSVTGTWFATC